MDDVTDARIRRLRSRIQAMLDQSRPDRYTVDEHGHAPWMDEVVDRIAEDPGITVADLKLIRHANILDELFVEAGIVGGEVVP